MDNTIKVWLIIGAVLVILGLMICTVVMSLCNWNFSGLSTVNYNTNIHPIEEDFTAISLTTDTADILFALSDDGKCKVVCQEQENLYHTVGVQDGKLTVQVVDQRKWYEHIGFSFGHSKITVYLPNHAYAGLTVDTDTGKVTLPQDFSFESMELSVKTGDVRVLSSVSQTVKIQTTTGDIRVEGISAGAMALSVTTGHVDVSNVTCAGDARVDVSTGDVRMTDVTCKNLNSIGSTGDLVLSGVIAGGAYTLERSTGDIRFHQCDAAEISVKASTGTVTGSLLSSKVFTARTDTGRVAVPDTTTGGRCEIATNTGNIKITIEE